MRKDGHWQTPRLQFLRRDQRRLRLPRVAVDSQPCDLPMTNFLCLLHTKEPQFCKPNNHFFGKKRQICASLSEIPWGIFGQKKSAAAFGSSLREVLPDQGCFFFDKTPPKCGQFFYLERPEKFEKSLILRHLVERNHPRKFEIFQEMWLFWQLREANPPLREVVALETFSYRGIAVQSCSKSHISWKPHFQSCLSSETTPMPVEATVMSF